MRRALAAIAAAALPTSAAAHFGLHGAPIAAGHAHAVPWPDLVVAAVVVWAAAVAARALGRGAP
jgi:hypothetical protein